MFKITFYLSGIILFVLMNINMSLAQDNKGKLFTKVKNMVAKSAKRFVQY